jgi:VanZ family protein
LTDAVWGWSVRNWRIVSPLATLALSIAYLWLAVQPTVPQPLERFSDKLLHAVGYLLLAALACVASRHLGLPRPLAVGWSYAVVHGALLEAMQHFYPPRQASLADLLADAVGATLAVGLLWRRTRVVR